ncbi:hypothetical protein niasHS_001586 [Heterodera schachtii]|uniref:RGS domain-containing protein n=1 Tax=Heterodera schachtii TaxID=97005 RepID=A0ABD2KE58_HETSC
MDKDFVKDKKMPKSPNFSNKNLNLFKEDELNRKQTPQMPPMTSIEYARALSWGSATLADLMKDALGRQVFRCFLHETFAEENLLFVEAVEKLRGVNDAEIMRNGVAELLKKYGVYVNLSSAAMGKLREATKAQMPDFKSVELANKEIYMLLENDQLPRFRRSELYQKVLKKLMPQ